MPQKYFKATWEGMINMLWEFITRYYDQYTRYYDYNLNLVVYYLEGSVMIAAYELEDLKKAGYKTIERFKTDKEFLPNILSEYGKNKNLYLEACYQNDNIDLSLLEIEEVMNRYENLSHLVNQLGGICFVEPVSIILGDYIKEELEKSISDQVKVLNYQGIIASTYRRSFLEEEELDLISIYKKIKEKGLTVDEYTKDREISALLESHRKQYYWMKNSYLKAQNLDLDFFVEKLHSISDIDLAKLEINKEQQVKDEKCKLLAEVNNENILLYSNLADELVYTHDQRKKFLLMFQGYLWRFLEELAKRKNVTKEEIGYYRFEEIKANITITPEEISQRKNSTVILYQNGEKKFYTGEAAKKWKEELLKQDKTSDKELKGMVACPGKVQGKVRVLLSTQEINTIQEGEVLVASNTTPDYLPAMKKAIAFLTEKGGVTSHAAIVSREMKKPCIVGINGITSILKTGDMVEVDAEKGVVKKLN